MSLGSAATSKIDIDFTRAQGAPSSGQIIFKPKRTSLGSTVISPFPIVVDVVAGVGSVDLVRLPVGVYEVQELIDGTRGRPFSFLLPTLSPSVIQYETIAPVEVVPSYFTSVKTINNVAPNPTTGNINIDGTTGPQGPPGPPGADGADGEDGAQGIQGPPGTNGTNGSNGAPGIQGPPGEDGADGAPGIQGPPGDDGAQGIQGPPGTPGADGADGADGTLELYPPSAAGFKEWTADPQVCSADFNHGGAFLLMMRFCWRQPSGPLSEIGFAVTATASAPGAYSGVALYEDGVGIVNRLGQSADVGSLWTTQGVKSAALTAPVSMVKGNYYYMAVLWNGGSAGKIAGVPLVILDALMNAGKRRSVYLTGQATFPSTINIGTANTNNATYWLSAK